MLEPLRWTQKASKAIHAGMDLARSWKNPEVLPTHLLLALISETDGVVVPVLRKAGIEVVSLKKRLENELRELSSLFDGAYEIQVSQELRDLIGQAEGMRIELGDEYLSIEHLLIALAENIPVEKEPLLVALAEVEGSCLGPSRNPEEPFQALEQFGRDLTEEARQGNLDPVIGRDEEIRRVIQVLSRRTKNNPVLIGEPGVGKTAVVEGLARRIIEGDVPEGLQDRRVVALDIGAMVAGAKYRGEFEERLKAVLEEITGAGGEVLTFIDEVHSLVGAGAVEGAMDASNMLKPLLARGQLRMIGATTLDEFRKHIEKDPALERRFQQVLVSEPSVEDSIAILRGLKERYELHHGVRIQDGALVAAAVLSDRYISGRFLPDKAIDLIDEAGSMLRIEIDSMPTEIDQVDRRIRQLEIESVALQNETDEVSTERLAAINQEVGNLQEEVSGMKAQWTSEKEAIGNIQILKESSEVVRSQIEAHEREGNLAEAAELQYGKLPDLKQQIMQADRVLTDLQAERQMLKEEIDQEDIAKVVSRWTGIPIVRMMEEEVEKLIRLEEVLKERVVGQRKPLSVVANAIRRNRVGLSDPDRPIGSFLFLGPTGVGKTELARSLAEFLFDDERAMVRIDMSEYMEKHSASRLIGAPPGYVGYEEGGQLTEAVRRYPYSVVLLDEVEKAHYDVFNVLLQLLDEGRLTDSQGRTVDFKNVILIMTSNLSIEPEDFFRPEFINRIDEIVRFEELDFTALGKIVDIQLENLKRRITERRMTLKIDEAARSVLTERGFDPSNGARPLKRVIQRDLGDQLASAILEGRFVDGDYIAVGVDEDGVLSFT